MNVIVDWDKENDIIYVLKKGFDPDSLLNVDSDKVPGVVKRMDPQSNECVGFIIDSFLTYSDNIKMIVWKF